MKKRSILTMILAAGLTLAASFCSFAGEWKQDTTGWFYQNTDGSYLSNGWYWVNGKSYYFNEQGYCLTSTTTPDGYTVDDSGAWTENGVVKTRATEETISGIRVVIPNGYDYTRDDESGSIGLYQTNGSDYHILIMTVKYDGIALIRDLYGMEGLKSTSDTVVGEMVPELSPNAILNSSSSKTYSNTGAWNYYGYKTSNNDTSAGNLDFYTNFADTEMHIILIIDGAGREFTSNDQFMENCIR